MLSNYFKKLDYTLGKFKLNYDISKFDFKTLLLEELNHKINKYGLNLEKLENIHKLNQFSDNPELLRQCFFDIFRGHNFQNLYKSFAIFLIDNFFNENALIQRTPIIRIQFPKANSTSFHTDGWYGHSNSARSFWMPLMPVNEKNTLFMARNEKESLDLINIMIKEKLSLLEINNSSINICEPFIGNYGDILTFKPSMIHGTNINLDKKTRISFDFRININDYDLGTKPRSNYYSRSELEKDNLNKNQDKKNILHLQGISYSNRCSKISAKTQLNVCYRFAEEHGIQIDGNESEILIFEHLPVLEHYINEKDTLRNCIIVFGIEIFNGDKNLAIDFYKKAKESKKKIIFCAQGVIFDAVNQSKNDLLKLF